MRRLELLGQGIQHSASPGMWNRIFAATASDATYGLRDIGSDGLMPALDDLRSGAVAGYQVTMPFKQWAYEVAERRSPDVRRSRVANGLAVEDGRVVALNTDVSAARLLLGELPERPKRVLVLGAGATGTSLALASSEVAGEVFVANRSPERSRWMAGLDWPHRVQAVAWEDRETCAADVDVIVNATSCGLTTNASPLRSWTAGDVALYDLIYRPEPTELQRQAADADAVIVDGLAHLQAHAEVTIPQLGLPVLAVGELRDIMAAALGRHPLRWERLS